MCHGWKVWSESTLDVHRRHEKGQQDPPVIFIYLLIYLMKWGQRTPFFNENFLQSMYADMSGLQKQALERSNMKYFWISMEHWQPMKWDKREIMQFSSFHWLLNSCQRHITHLRTVSPTKPHVAENTVRLKVRKGVKCLHIPRFSFKYLLCYGLFLWSRLSKNLRNINSILAWSLGTRV